MRKSPRQYWQELSDSTQKIVMGVSAGLGTLLLLVLMVAIATSGDDARVQRAIVRISAGTASGTGFFVEGPDRILIEIVEAKPIPEGIWD